MRIHIHIDPHRELRRAEHVMHLIYTGSVAVFAHDVYAYAAGGLFVLGIVAYFVHENVEP